LHKWETLPSKPEELNKTKLSHDQKP
jgi:hypothetical protein